MFWPASVEDPFVGKEKEGAAVEARPRMTVAEGLFAADAAKLGGTKRKAEAEAETSPVMPTTKTEAVAGSSSCASGVVGGRKMRMPMDYLELMLQMPRESYPIPHDYDDLPEEEQKLIMELVDDFKMQSDEMEVYQAEIRHALDTDGYYEVGEDYFQRQDELQAYVKEEWAKMKWTKKGKERSSTTA